MSLKPHDLLTEEILKCALKVDLGSQWELEDFKIKDFTKKGDHYISAVTSVTCTAICDGVQKETFYVAKLNPLQDSGRMEEGINNFFVREGKFLTDISPRLNTILQNLQHKKVNFPQCIYFSSEKKQEVIILNDLRKDGFKMFDRKVGMDVQHSELVVQELAKLHASSYIFKFELPSENVLDIYPFLEDPWCQPTNRSRQIFGYFLKGCIGNSLKLLQQVKGYERQCTWLMNLSDRVVEVYTKLIQECSEKMKLISHGDCWNNNTLFRYDNEGKLQEVALLDLQLCRYASIGLDLNYFLYTSLSGATRRRIQDHLLSVYYDMFRDIITGADLPMPFTIEELKEELRIKKMFGIINGLMSVQVMIHENEDVIQMKEMKGKDIGQYMNDYGDKVVKMLEESNLFKDRFLSILDDV